MACRCQYVKVQCRIIDQDRFGSVWKEVIVVSYRDLRGGIE